MNAVTAPLLMAPESRKGHVFFYCAYRVAFDFLMFETYSVVLFLEVAFAAGVRQWKQNYDSGTAALRGVNGQAPRYAGDRDAPGMAWR